MSYQQLTEGRRYQISALLELGISTSKIAKTVKCHRSTVYRELKRGGNKNKYCPKDAHARSVRKRRDTRKYKIPQERIEFIRLLLETDWSPEQISNVLTRAGSPVSHEWIYRLVASDKRQGGKLYRHLRQGHKLYRRGRSEKLKMLYQLMNDHRLLIVERALAIGKLIPS